jgi:hypothetical protein
MKSLMLYSNKEERYLQADGRIERLVGGQLFGDSEWLAKRKLVRTAYKFVPRG